MTEANNRPFFLREEVQGFIVGVVLVGIIALVFYDFGKRAADKYYALHPVKVYEAPLTGMTERSVTCPENIVTCSNEPIRAIWGSNVK